MRVAVALLTLWCALVVALFVVAADRRVAVVMALMSLWGALVVALVVATLAMVGVVGIRKRSSRHRRRVGGGPGTERPSNR